MANRMSLSVESRIRGNVYVRFGGRFSETYRSNAARRRVPSLHGLFDIEKRESIKTLILTLWKRDNEPPTRAEEVALSNAVSLYIDRLKDGITPSFNTFCEFIRGEYSEILETKKVREKDFDIANFLNVLEPYYKGGEYDYLLNSDRELDLLSKRLIVFELDNIKDHKILFPIVTIIIMEVFINKMRFFSYITVYQFIIDTHKANR